MHIPGKIIFKSIVGSQAYGTNTETSDVDIKGVYIQDKSLVCGFNTYQDQINVTKDECYFEIGRFMELLQKGNPTVIELLYSPQDCILESTEEWNILMKHKDLFLTNECRKSFIGYAESQIKKASGTDKKFNWEEKNMIRKDPMDFCYVVLSSGQESFQIEGNIVVKQGTLPLKEWLALWGYDQNNCILNKIDHSQDVYQLYHYPGKLTRGIQSEDGNDIRVDSSEKDSNPIATIIFNKNSYSVHCKKYREYTEWLEKRNTQRYIDINEHGQKIDGKNMLHCTRLLRMGEEIMSGKGVIVRRTDAAELLDIRKGKYNLEQILEKAHETIDRLRKIETDLPDKTEDNIIHEILVDIRNYHEGRVFIISSEQYKKFNDWKHTFGKLPYIGATGGHFSIEFFQSSIGDVIYGKNWNNDKIDLTDYDEL